MILRPSSMKRQRINWLPVWLGAALLSFNVSAAEVSEDYKSMVESKFEAQEKWMREAIAAQEEKARLALESAKSAIDKSEQAANDRFASHNEFRSQLKDQAGTFLTRTEALAYLAAMVGLAAFMQRKQGKE